MNKSKLSFGIGIIIVLLGGLGLAYTLNQPKDVAAKPTASASPTTTVSASPAAKSLTYDGVEGKTALELLKAKDPSAETKGEGANTFVTAINGYHADDSKKEYWSMYVNGKYAEVGAGQYVTKAGDKIEWKIATY